MKKIFFSVLAIAALAACTKSEVQYDAPQEIGFAPATKNITKAANSSGFLNSDDQLGVWALWNYNSDVNTVDGSTGAITATGENPNPYTGYDTEYLANVKFGNRQGSNNWGGVDSEGNVVNYPWPTNGALVFAGYTIPEGKTINASYTLNDNAETPDVDESDAMTFTDYTQSENPADTYDLCWFGATSRSYDRTTSGAVPVTLSHALTWITFKVMGASAQSLPVTGEWKVINVVLNGVKTVGTGVCKGTTTTEDGKVTPATALWTSSVSKDMTVFAGEHPITDSAVTIEEEGEENGLVIIPQTPTSVTVKWRYAVGTGVFEETRVIPLTLTPDNEWKAGVHYTYTIVFNGNEILLTPEYSGWDTVDQTVTVQ